MALALWRQKPCASLAAVVSAISSKVPKQPAPGRLEVLLAEPDPLLLPEVLACLGSSNSSPAMKRGLEQLSTGWSPDPRITDFLFNLLGAPPWDLSSGNPAELAAFAVKMLAESPDARVEPWVRDLPAFFKAHKGTRKGQLSREEIQTLEGLFGAARFVARTVELTPEETSALRAIEAELRQADDRARDKGSEGDRLLEMVIADWDSDEPKQVYADWLQERGESQGELISLELQPGPRSPEVEARIAELRRHVSVIPGARLEKGFPREVSYWRGDLGPTGAWDERRVWGTVEACDVPPMSDACHTESLRTLRVGLTYLPDLARLEKPLPVTHLGIFSASERARAALKKVRVLPKIETLELIHPTSDDFHWVFSVPWLTGIRRLVFSIGAGRSMPGPGTVAALAFFELGPRLEEVQLGTLLRLRRGPDGRKTLVMTANDRREVESLRDAFAPVPRPSFDRVEIHTPFDALDGLEQLGREQQVVKTASEAARRAGVSVEGEVLVVKPHAASPLVDPQALRELVEARPSRPSKLRTSGVRLEWLAQYLSVLDQLGIAEAWLTGTGTSGTLSTLHRTADAWLELSLATYAFPRDILCRLNPTRIRLRCNPWVELEAVAAPLREAGHVVEAIHDEAVRAGLFDVKVVKSARRLELKARGSTGNTPVPATLELLRPDRTGLKEVRACVDSIALAPVLGDWIEWLDRQDPSLTLSFESTRGRVSTFERAQDGLEGSLCLEHLGFSVQRTWAPELARVPTGRLARLRVQRRGTALDAAVEQQLARMALTLAIA